MLTSLSIKKFKNLDNLCLKELGSINYIIGPNGSGKSSIYEALFSGLNLYNISTNLNEQSKEQQRLLKTVRSYFGDLRNIFKSGDTEIAISENDKSETLSVSEVTSSNLYMMWDKVGKDANESLCNYYFIAGAQMFDGFKNLKNTRSIYQNLNFNTDEIVSEKEKELVIGYLNEYYFNKKVEVRNIYRGLSKKDGSLQVEIVDKKSKELISIQNYNSIGFGVRKIIEIAIAIDKIQTNNRSCLYPNGEGINSVSKNIIFLEEPEIFLHPYLQKELPKVFQNIVKKNPSLQLFVTTHSPYLITSALSNADNQLPTKVYSISDGKALLEEGISSKHLPEIFLSLGSYSSDFLFADYVIWLEGPTDQVIVDALVKKIIEKKAISKENLLNYSYCYLSNLLLHRYKDKIEEDESDKSIDFTKLNPHYSVIIDSDTHTGKRKKSQKDFVKELKKQKKGAVYYNLQVSTIEMHFVESLPVEGKLSEIANKFKLYYKPNKSDKKINRPTDNEKQEIGKCILEFIDSTDLDDMKNIDGLKRLVSFLDKVVKKLVR